MEDFLEDLLSVLFIDLLIVLACDLTKVHLFVELSDLINNAIEPFLLALGGVNSALQLVEEGLVFFNELGDLDLWQDGHDFLVILVDHVNVLRQLLVFLDDLLVDNVGDFMFFAED